MNAIAPGPIETKLKFLNASLALLPKDEAKKVKTATAESVPLGRIGDPREIADTIIFLASNASRSITRETMVVDGGSLI